MRLPRNVNLMLLLFLIFLNIFIRFPRTPHEIGVDGFTTHALTNSISQNGYAKWIVNPISWFGLYPLSYPSGGMFLTSEFSQIGAIPIEGAIFLENMLISIVGLLAMYLLAKEIKNDDRFAFFAAFIFTIAPRFLAYTLWETPSRSMFMAFTPLFLLMLLKIHKNPSFKNIGILFGVFIVILSAHRLAIMMLIVLFGYLFTYIFMVIRRIFKLKYPKIFLHPSRRRLVTHLSALAFISSIFLMIYFTGILDRYRVGFMSGDDILTSFLNLGFSIANSAGILLPFIALGIIAVIYFKNKTLKEYLFLFIIIGIIPTLTLRTYYGFYIVAFTSLFIAIGLLITSSFIQRRSKKIAVIVITLSFAAAVFVSNGYVSNRMSRDILPNETYGTGIYVKYNTDATFISNDGLLGSKVSSISGKAYLPIGGATLPPNGTELLAFGFVGKQQIIARPLPFQELKVDDDYLFVFSIEDVPVWEWLEISRTDANSLKAKIESRYNLKYAIERADLEGQYVVWLGPEYSRLFTSLHNSRYQIYTNGVDNLWLVT